MDYQGFSIQEDSVIGSEGGYKDDNYATKHSELLAGRPERQRRRRHTLYPEEVEIGAYSGE
jgi:hypothetical protein